MPPREQINYASDKEFFERAYATEMAEVLKLAVNASYTFSAHSEEDARRFQQSGATAITNIFIEKNGFGVIVCSGADLQVTCTRYG